MAMEQKYTTWHIESPRALGTALRDARKQAGLSQTGLAEHLGTTRHRISRLERGDVSDQLLLMMRTLDRLQLRLCLERR